MAMNLFPKEGVTIVICCFNSSAKLYNTLKGISLQHTDVPLEIILVDNASKDNTVQIAENAWNELGSPFKLKIVSEPKPGLSFAREKGIAEAEFDCIIFCDDDNWLAQDYAFTAYTVMKENPEIGVLGARSEPVSDIELPFWFSTYQANYAVGVLALKSGDITSRGEIWGAGMIFRKSDYLRLKQLGFSNILSDRKGEQLSGGGDTEICKWFLYAGKKLWYDDRLSFKHYIEPKRLSYEYIEKVRSENEKNFSIIRKYDIVLEANKASKLIRGFSFFKYLFQSFIFNSEQRKVRNVAAYLEAFNLFPVVSFDKDIAWLKNLYKKANIDQN